jgi:ferric-dicitrate binding protein FerR (iron transport regulator)
LSAALPALDSDAALSAIAQTLPVRIERFSRYWVQVTARGVAGGVSVSMG